MSGLDRGEQRQLGDLILHQVRGTFRRHEPGCDRCIHLGLDARLVTHRCVRLRRVGDALRDGKTELSIDELLDVSALLDRVGFGFHACLGDQRRRAGHAVGIRKSIEVADLRLDGTRLTGKHRGVLVDLVGFVLLGLALLGIEVAFFQGLLVGATLRILDCL